MWAALPASAKLSRSLSWAAPSAASYSSPRRSGHCKGCRIWVSLILALLATGLSEADVLAEYP
ncbi:MAG TPA: DUF433 domain-containing protein [Chloroflexota bacterium]|nr:DUF433 domain-containing protein [Chloroflexota bacterium]